MKYIYSGPPSGATLQGGQEVLLFPGQAVELEPDNPYTRTLVAQNRLSPMAAAPTPTTQDDSAPMSKKGGKA